MKKLKKIIFSALIVSLLFGGSLFTSKAEASDPGTGGGHKPSPNSVSTSSYYDPGTGGGH